MKTFRLILLMIFLMTPLISFSQEVEQGGQGIVDARDPNMPNANDEFYVDLPIVGDVDDFRIAFSNIIYNLENIELVLKDLDLFRNVAGHAITDIIAKDLEDRLRAAFGLMATVIEDPDMPKSQKEYIVKEISVRLYNLMFRIIRNHGEDVKDASKDLNNMEKAAVFFREFFLDIKRPFTWKRSSYSKKVAEELAPLEDQLRRGEIDQRTYEDRRLDIEGKYFPEFAKLQRANLERFRRGEINSDQFKDESQKITAAHYGERIWAVTENRSRINAGAAAVDTVQEFAENMMNQMDEGNPLYEKSFNFWSKKWLPIALNIRQSRINAQYGWSIIYLIGAMGGFFIAPKIIDLVGMVNGYSLYSALTSASIYATVGLTIFTSKVLTISPKILSRLKKLKNTFENPKKELARQNRGAMNSLMSRIPLLNRFSRSRSGQSGIEVITGVSCENSFMP